MVEAATNRGSDHGRLDEIAARSTAMRDFDGNGSTADHGERLPSGRRLFAYSWRCAEDMETDGGANGIAANHDRDGERTAETSTR